MTDNEQQTLRDKLAAAGLIPKLRAIINNPKRFVLGAVISSVVGWVLKTLILGLNLATWLAGFEVPGVVRVNGDAVNVPWCGAGTCDVTSLVDIPNIVIGGLTDGFGQAGDQLLRAVGSIWAGLPTAGIAGPFIMFVVAALLVVALYWGVRLLIAVSPVSLP